ncbi:MAG: hypothetical protein SO147_01490 [Clostridia bacterium]|nr:hypothetical protein [Clostridia bacterium]
MINVNDFKGLNDNEIIENAIRNKGNDGIIVIPSRVSDIEPDRNWWLLDRAILIPKNTTVVLVNCKIKLSDKCRDNFFRTANCGMGIAFPEQIHNVHIKGVGNCVLEGADHPRATGDGAKIIANPCPYTDEDLCKYAYWIPEERKQSGQLDYFLDKLHYSYGTDAGKSEESQYSDWRGIGVLFANTDNFSIENIKIVNSHGWGISLEACTNGRVEKISFDSCLSKEIDGMLQNIKNQDGIDLRNGCHHIIISDITGRTGDDLIALTAIAIKDRGFIPGGSMKYTHVMHNDWTKRDKNIHDIIIRNVVGYSLCSLIRLLPVETKIWNVVIDGVVDTSPDNIEPSGGILLGDLDNSYGKNMTDSMSNITISNVVCNRQDAICVKGYLSNSVISNIINRRNKCHALSVRRENGLKNVKINNLTSVDIEPVFINGVCKNEL